MSNEEYTIVTNINAPVPSEEHRELGQSLYESAFGFADHIVEGRSTFLTKDDKGHMNFTLVTFDRNREQQVKVTQRTMAQEMYSNWVESFDRSAKVLMGEPTQITTDSE